MTNTGFEAISFDPSFDAMLYAAEVVACRIKFDELDAGNLEWLPITGDDWDGYLRTWDSMSSGNTDILNYTLVAHSL